MGSCRPAPEHWKLVLLSSRLKSLSISRLRMAITRAAVLGPLVLFSELLLANTNTWSLASPDGRCVISVELTEGGSLAYQASFDGKPLILNSPLGLIWGGQNFKAGLTLQGAGKVKKRHESYELLAGPNPRID